MDTLTHPEPSSTHPSVARPNEDPSEVLTSDIATRRVCVLHLGRSALRIQHLMALSDSRRGDIRAQMDRDADAACQGFATASKRIASSVICPLAKVRETEALKDALARRLETIRNAGRAALEHEHAGFLAALDALSSATAPGSWPAWPADR